MKAAVLHNTRNIQVMEKEPQALKGYEVMIQVKSCGICGTDQHIYHGHPGSASVTPPVILGHELAGVVVDVGATVTTLKVGDRVSVDPNIYCGNCEFCRKGRVHLCNHLQAVGVTRDGGMAEYCAVPEANCYLIPDEMSMEEAALVEPLGCVLHGFKKLMITPNSSVLIIGGGFIGQLFLQLVRSKGASQIIVAEPVESKHKLLYRLGANIVINTKQQNTEDLQDKADIVIECVGRAETMELACDAARKGGQVLLFGVSSPETEISISPFKIFSKELVIQGSFINPYTHEEAISLISQKIVQVLPLISHRFNIKELPEIMQSYSTLQVSKGIIVD